MKLLEATERSAIARKNDGPVFRVRLAVGFTPLSLQTFVEAHLGALLPTRRIAVEVGDYDDLQGTLGRTPQEPLHGVLCAIEWADLDPRLSARSAAPHTLEVLDQIVAASRQRAVAIADAMIGSGFASRVVCPPSLSLPPVFPSRSATLSRWEAQLAVVRSELVANLVASGVEVLNDDAVAIDSPVGKRWSLKSELEFGFPYTVRHADSIAAHLARALVPPDRRKGLIVDLDNTLWSGIVGDDGVSALSWDLASGSQQHALFQRLVNLLAETGILVGVASKNDSAVAEAGLARPDLLVQRERLFPVVAGWGPKSVSIADIARTWNVGLESLVFVDDSAVERGEVAEASAGVEVLAFPADNVDDMPVLLGRLRDLFGASTLSAEDLLRLQSVRANAALESELQSSGEVREEFLAGLDATLTVAERTVTDGQRAIQLINKTNQFNLNGTRWDAAEIDAFLSDGGRLFTVDYTDRYGRLGEISALLVRAEGRALEIRAWVLSCRAFSRRIEYQTLRGLLAQLAPDTVRFAVRETGRNSVLLRALRVIGGEAWASPHDSIPADLTVSASSIVAALPAGYGTLDVAVFNAAEDR